MTTPTRIMLLVLLGVVTVMNQPRAAAQETGLLARLQVGTHVYFPDGRSVSRWNRFDVPGKVGAVTGAVHGGYALLFANDPKRHPTGYGWEVKVTPVKEVGDTLIARVDWKRSRDRGQVTEAPERVRRAALAPGKSVPLDYIVPGPSIQQCVRAMRCGRDVAAGGSERLNDQGTAGFRSSGASSGFRARSGVDEVRGCLGCDAIVSVHLVPKAVYGEFPRGS